MESKEPFGLPPRPGSALSRPGTASGGRNNIGFSKFADEAKTSTALLQRQIEGDSLLRILDEKKSELSNDALLYAETGNIVGIRKMIENGEDILSVRGLGGYSLLHHACNRGHAGIVNELLKVYFPTSLKCDSGETPLHLAVYAGNMLIVEQLLDGGADIDACNSYNETPLFYAARRSYPALVRLLMQRGADVDAQDQFGERAIDHASNEHTRRAFVTLRIEASSTTALPHNLLLRVFKYLTAKEVCRAACVSGKWHRVSESEEIWQALGLRRWEYALQSSLGFGQLPSSSFRLRRPSSKDKLVSGKPPKPK